MASQPAPVVREATLSDIPAVVAFAQSSFTATFAHLYSAQDLALHLGGYTPEKYAAFLSQGCRTWGAFLASGVLVGYVVAGPCGLPHPDASAAHGEIYKLYVDEAFKGRGVADVLMTTAVAWIQGSFPARPIYLGVWSENRRAQKFYARHGFAKCGEYIYEVGAARDQEWIMRTSA